MKESNLERSPLKEEQQKLEEDMELVSQTEGYSHLTETQQRLLKQSLYIQARADRGDYVLGEYEASAEHTHCWNCHFSIANLEQEKGLSEQMGAIPKDFFGAQYEKVESFEELKKIVEGQEFPVVLFVKSVSEKNSISEIQHSCLVMGHDKEGNLLVFEKMGMVGPYRITTLKKVYIARKQLGENISWGIRKLATTEKK